MAKRLIIATNSATASRETRNAITQFLKTKGWSTWHWFEDLWLAVDIPDDIRADALRDELVKIVPAKNFFIFLSDGSLEESGWAMKESLPWIEEKWRKK